MGAIGSGDGKEEVVKVILSEEDGNLGVFFDNLFLSWVKFLRRGKVLDCCERRILGNCCVMRGNVC